MKKLLITLLAFMIVLTFCVSCTGKESPTEESEMEADTQISEESTTDDSIDPDPESESIGGEDTTGVSVPLEKDTDDFTYNY